MCIRNHTLAHCWAVGLAALVALAIHPLAMAQSAGKTPGAVSAKAPAPPELTPAQLADQLVGHINGLQRLSGYITEVADGRIGCGCVGPHVNPHFEIQPRHYSREDVERVLKAVELIMSNGNANKPTEVVTTPAHN